MKFFITLILLALLIFIKACTVKEIGNVNENQLHDIWALESIEGEHIIIDETVKNLPVLEIYLKKGRVHGNTSCNTINGKLNIDGNKISFHEIITTEMACPGNLEQRFLFALNEVNNYKIEKMILYLFEGDTELLVFKKID